MDAKIRYTPKEAQAALGLGNTRFWALVKAGRLRLYYDGPRAFVSRAELVRYDAECQEVTTNPTTGRPRAVPGKRGIQIKDPVT